MLFRSFSPDKELQQHFAARKGIVLSQGFIARNAQGETVLLGRGGSDTTGAYLAGKLEARRLEIWTDAPGFFSADPKAVPADVEMISRDGRMVPFVVRVETGTINRGIYEIAVLHNPNTDPTPDFATRPEIGRAHV